MPDKYKAAAEPQPHSDILNLNRALDEANQLLVLHEDWLSDVEQRLRRSEHELTMAEEKISGHAEGMLPQDSLVSCADRSFISAVSDDASIYAPSSAALAPDLREYHHRVGDITIWKERLYNLQLHHRKNAILRDEIAGRGEQLVPPERAFREAFYTERESMIRQIHEAQRDARRLRTVCLDQGLGPEGDMPFELQDEAFDQSAGVRGILDRSTGASNEALLAPSGPLRFLSLDPTNVHKRIETWLTDLDEDAGPPFPERPQSSPPDLQPRLFQVSSGASAVLRSPSDPLAVSRHL
ncbi:hypothetical protein LTS18_008154 [Coniosporium uncinatum]|uniref:Uncharacterized protein n=1 Tax=Coniosporium uncinatum TaxID=93489 RepID=A0ACC3DYR7_9PEZI|nr:hypothetical protein LTS18_008154 [Coniosporium uncinatum]